MDFFIAWPNWGDKPSLHLLCSSSRSIGKRGKKAGNTHVHLPVMGSLFLDTGSSGWQLASAFPSAWHRIPGEVFMLWAPCFNSLVAERPLSCCTVVTLHSLPSPILKGGMNPNLHMHSAICDRY